MPFKTFAPGELSSPRQVGGVTPTSDSTAGAIGAALGGLADILDVGLKASERARQARVSGAVEDALGEQAKRFQDQGKPQEVPDLVGEAAMRSGDPENWGYTADQVYKMEGLRQGNNQGRISRAEFYAKTSAIVQQAIHDNPRFADAIRKRAQEVLGVNPTTAGIALEMEGQKAAEDLQRAQTEFLVGEAMKRGIGVRNTDDSIDVANTIKQVQQVLVSENYLRTLNQTYDANLKWMELKAKEQGRDLTESEKRNMLISQFMGGDSAAGVAGSDAVFHANIDSFFTSIPGIVAKNQNLKEPDQEALMMGEIGQKRLMFMGWLNSQLNQVTMHPEDKQKIRDNYSSQFAQYEDFAKGGFSNLQRNITALKQLETQAGLDGWKVAPRYKRAEIILGPTVMAQNAALAMASSAGTSAREAQDKEIINASDAIWGGAQVAAGEKRIEDFKRPEDRRQIAQQVGSTAEITARQIVTGTSENEQLSVNSFGNSMADLSGTLSRSNSVDNLRGGLRYTASPQIISALDKLAQSSPDQAALIGVNMLGANAKAIVLTGQSILQDLARLAPSASNDYFDIVSQGLLAGDTGQQVDIKAPSNPDWQVVYNAETGLVEAMHGPMSSYTENDLFKSRPPIPPEVAKKIGDMNKALKAQELLAANYGSDKLKSMDGPAIKSEFIKNTGLPIIGINGDQEAMSFDPKVVAKIESGNNPNAVGPKVKGGTAKGSMQVMDAVAKNPGFGVTPAKDDSIEERDRVGRDLLKAFEEQFGEDDPVVLVAYNWGPGNAKKWVDRGRKWSELPSETQKYVGRYYLEKANIQ